jgi:hypothetical protein
MPSEKSGKYSGLNNTSVGIPDRYIKNGIGSFNMVQGNYIARVIDNVDNDYNGAIWVELVGQQSIVDTSTEEGRKSTFKVRRMSPFGGSIQGSNYGNNFGAAFPPPTPGTEVLVGFTGTDHVGFLLGILPDSNRNASVPGLPSGQIAGEDAIGPTFDSSTKSSDKARHPVANAHAVQGIGYDAVRGPGSSGGRRESPSNVSGFLTPVSYTHLTLPTSP